MQAGSIDQASAVLQTLLAQCAPESSICPSEVARSLAAAGGESSVMDWRNAMPLVHAAVDQLVAEGTVQLSWKGEPLPARAGPYRIKRAR